jgi:hypothetical protein
MGSTSMDLTNHRLKIFRKNGYIVLNVYTLFFMLLFPKQYSVTAVYIAFALHQVLQVI